MGSDRTTHEKIKRLKCSSLFWKRWVYCKYNMCKHMHHVSRSFWNVWDTAILWQSYSTFWEMQPEDARGLFGSFYPNLGSCWPHAAGEQPDPRMRRRNAGELRKTTSNFYQRSTKNDHLIHPDFTFEIS